MIKGSFNLICASQVSQTENCFRVVTSNELSKQDRRFLAFTTGNVRCRYSLWIKSERILNPVRSSSDQRPISLCNINAFSVREVMRIKDMITQHEFRW